MKVADRSIHALHLGRDGKITETTTEKQNGKDTERSEFCRAVPKASFTNRFDMIRDKREAHQKHLQKFWAEKTRSSSQGDLVTPSPSICKNDIKEFQTDLTQWCKSEKLERKMEDVTTSNLAVSSVSAVKAAPEMAYHNSLAGFWLPYPSSISACNAFKAVPTAKTTTPIRSLYPMLGDIKNFNKKIPKSVNAHDILRNSDRSTPDSLDQSGDRSRQVSIDRDETTGLATLDAELVGCYEYYKGEGGEKGSSFHKDKTSMIQTGEDNLIFEDHLSRPLQIERNNKKDFKSKEKNFKASSQVNTIFKTSSSTAIISLMQSSDLPYVKSKTPANIFQGKSEKSTEKSTDSCNSFHGELKTNKGFLFQTESFSPTQSQEVSPCISASVVPSMNKSHLRVATLGPNIPVFLTACDTLDQNKVSRKAKQLSPSPAEGSPHTECRQGYTISYSSYEKADRVSRSSRNDMHFDLKPFKGLVSVNHSQVFSLKQTHCIDGCAKEDLFSPIKYRREKGRDSAFLGSVEQVKPAVKQVPNLKTFPEQCMQGSSSGAALPKSTLTNSINGETVSLYKYSRKLNNISPQMTDDEKSQRIAPPLFKPVQATAGEALVFLSPSTSFQKPTTTPTISQSRQLLPNICVDGTSPLMPYAAQLSAHNIKYALNSTLVNHSKPLALQQQSHVSTGACSLQEPVRRPGSHSTCDDVYNPSVVHTSSINVGRMPSTKASQIQPQPTLILLTDQRDFATPAFDLLSSVAKSPAVSEVFRLPLQSPQGASQHTDCNKFSPLLQRLPQTRNEPVSYNFQFRTSSAHAVNTSGSIFGTDCFTSKDHGYDVSSSRRLKRLKRHSSESFPSFWPKTSNLYSAAAVTNFERINSRDSANIFVDGYKDKSDATRWLVEASPGKKRQWEAIKNWDNLSINVHGKQVENTIINQSGENFTLVNNVNKTAPMSSRSNLSLYGLSISSSGISPASVYSSTLCTATTSATSVSKSIGNSTTSNTSSKPARFDNMCPVCCRLFSRSWLLKGHMRTHTGERPYQCSYPACHKAFADRSNLRSHMLTHTAASKNFSCPRCHRTFSQKRYLHKHATEVCKVNPDG